MAIRMKPDGSMEFDTPEEAVEFWSRIRNEKPFHNRNYSDRALIARSPNATPIQILEGIGDGRIGRLVGLLLNSTDPAEADDFAVCNIPPGAIPATIRTLKDFGERFGFGRDDFIVRTKLASAGYSGSGYSLTENAKLFLAEGTPAKKKKAV